MKKNKVTLQEHMASIAARGGKSTFKKHGKAHYKRMAAARWTKRNKINAG